MNDDPCFVELFKLRKMFESSFKIRGPGDQNAIEHLYSNDKVTLNFLLRPTDPDFDTSVLSTPEGIDIDLTLHRVSGPKATDSPARYARSPKAADPNESADHSAAPETTVEFFYQVSGLEDVRVNDPALPDLFKKSIQKVLSDYIVKNRTARRYVVYESLKFLDKNLARIYSISNSLKSQASGQVSQELQPPAELQADAGAKTPPDRESRETPWTLEEQKCLEEGLVRSKGLTDPREKWLMIAKLVKTRTPEECRKRFLRCREVLVRKHKPAEPPPPEEPTYSVDRTYPLALAGVEMVKLSLGQMGTLSIEILCTRCASRLEATLADTAEKKAVQSRRCEKCNLPLRCEFTPALFFPAQPVAGRLSLLNADFIDLNHAEFTLTCEECETQSRIRDVKIGDRKSFNCRGCFNKALFAFEGVQFGLRAEPYVAGVTFRARDTAGPRTVRHEPRKAPMPKGIRAGTPLPDNGTCKHYKKSFRWFRFPCCGRMFPCDVCHDDASDHKCGFANVIVCGFCSTQQPSSNKVCKACNKASAASSGSHWEVGRGHAQGGKGCRDATKLSRKDSRKYKLTNKANTKTKQ